MRGFIRSLIVLHRAFHSRDLRTRFHALIRFVTCPFLRVLGYVPPGARLLDVGAGHGVFSVLAVDRGAHVVAVEPDLRKVLAPPPHPPSAPSPPLRGGEGYSMEKSREIPSIEGERRSIDSAREIPESSVLRPAKRGEGARSADEGPVVPGVQFLVGFDDVIRGTFDVVAINDVLYKLPLEQWDALLTRALERLPSGGLLLVKEQDPTARVKNGWNRWQESLATKLRLTLGESFSYETPSDFTARLKRIGFAEVQAKRIDFGYPHAHMLYVAKKITPPS